MNQIRLKTGLRFFLALLLAGSCVSCRGMNYARNRLDNAEELLRQEKYDDAIALYKEHMQTRLRQTKRPEWENPYFYYLLIGDIELRRSNVDAAIKNYKTAQENSIHLTLISDRMRYVASWYEEKGKLEEAIEILKQNRELDPMLFDAVLDRLSKDLINKEELERRKTN